MSTGNSSVPQNPHTLNSVVGESNENMNEVNEQAEGVERVGLHLDGHDTPLNEETETQQEFQTNKRKKTSSVWVDFEVVNVAGVQKVECIHCHHRFAFNQTGTTTSYKRHQEKCAMRKKTVQEARENISKVKEIINTLYEEYVAESMNKGNSETPGSSNTFGSQTTNPTSTYHWDDFDAYCEEVETAEPTRSELVESRQSVFNMLGASPKEVKRKHVHLRLGLVTIIKKHTKSPIGIEPSKEMKSAVPSRMRREADVNVLCGEVLKARPKIIAHTFVQEENEESMKSSYAIYQNGHDVEAPKSWRVIIWP
nr:zinc finger BED domain-containing protein RICESLEEPER 2-like [Ipomoea batatas]